MWKLITCCIWRMISKIAIGLGADGGHIGFLAVNKLAQGWQSLGTLNVS